MLYITFEAIMFTLASEWKWKGLMWLIKEHGLRMETE